MRRTIGGGDHWATKCVSKHGENGPRRKNGPVDVWFTDWFPWNSRNIRGLQVCVEEGLRRIKEEGGGSS